MATMSSGGLRRAWAWERETDPTGSSTRTCSAWSPRRPWAMPNSTRDPALRVVTPSGRASERT